MKKMLALLGISLLIGGLSFAEDQNQSQTNPNDANELKRHSGTVRKVDAKEKTITLLLDPSTYRAKQSRHSGSISHYSNTNGNSGR